MVSYTSCRCCTLRPLYAVLMVGALLSCWKAALAGQTESPQAEKNETQLSAKELEAVQAKVKQTFSEHKLVQADIEEKVDDDLLGPMIEKGKLYIERPGKVLRMFYKKKKPWKATLMDGKKGSEYNPSRKKISEKDYSRAPKKLALIQAGANGDMDTFRKYYEVHGFKRAHASNLNQWRLVLVYKAKVQESDKRTLPYKRIHIIFTEGRAFFDEIRFEYQKGKGNDKIESYREIKAVKSFPKDTFTPELLKGKASDTELEEELEE